MDCPQCGYVLDPFENNCPRCARQDAPVAVTTQTSPGQDREVAVAIDKIAPRIPAGSVKAPTTRERLSDFAESPVLDKVMKMLLWAYIVILCMGIVYLSNRLHLFGPAGEAPPGNLGFWVLIIPVKLLLASIAMLFRRSWGLKVFTALHTLGLLFTIFAIILSFDPKPYGLLLLFLPAIAIIVIAILRIDDFD